MDPHSIGRPDPRSECGSGFRDPDPDPGGLKRAKMKKKRSKKPDN
jgi:hypothetical protein